MRAKTITCICGALIALAIGTTSVWAARKKAAPQTPLTEAGQKLLERYTGMLTGLRAEISKAAPAVNEQKKAAYLKARAAEKAAEAEVKAAQQRLGKVATAQALVNHAKGKWDKAQPVMVSLVKGRNVLRFSRNEPVKGLTIKDFTLKPLN